MVSALTDRASPPPNSVSLTNSDPKPVSRRRKMLRAINERRYSTWSLLQHIINLVAWGLLVAVTITFGMLGIEVLEEMPPTYMDVMSSSSEWMTLVNPPVWTWAIGLLVLVTEGIWTVVQLTVPSWKDSELVEAVGSKYLVICAAQVAWTVMMSLEYFIVALGLAVGLLVATFVLIVQLTNTQCTSMLDWIFLQMPFALHFGWMISLLSVTANMWLLQFGFSQEFRLYAALGSIAGVMLLAVIFLLCSRANGMAMAMVISWYTVRWIRYDCLLALSLTFPCLIRTT